jgi:hypothetical protein
VQPALIPTILFRIVKPLTLHVQIGVKINHFTFHFCLINRSFDQKSNTFQQQLKYLNFSSTNTMARETRNSNNKEGVSKDDVAKAKTSVRSLLGKRTE